MCVYESRLVKQFFGTGHSDEGMAIHPIWCLALVESFDAQFEPESGPLQLSAPAVVASAGPL